jgi:uncharacterized protein
MSIKKTIKNPFLLTGFYDKQYFCNRTTELNNLLDHYRNERNVVLYSWRRMGKTALIKYLFSELEKKEKAACLYVDIFPAETIAETIRLITVAVLEKFGKTSSGISETFIRLLSHLGLEMSFDFVSGTPKISLGYRQGIVAEKSLDALGEFLGNLNRRVVICLDEFQQAASFKGENAEAVFRTWVQNFPQIRFIFSGSHRNIMHAMFSEKKRPFYRSAQLLHLEPIRPDDYTRFIQRHFKAKQKTITTQAIADLYEWSRGQTYGIQLVCNKLFGRFDSVDTDYLQIIYDEILEQESHFFSGYARLLTSTQWNVLKAVAKEEPLSGLLSKEFSEKHRLGAASSISTAMKKLLDTELVYLDEGKYYVHDVLLTRWLQKL